MPTMLQSRPRSTTPAPPPPPRRTRTLIAGLVVLAVLGGGVALLNSQEREAPLSPRLTGELDRAESSRPAAEQAAASTAEAPESATDSAAASGEVAQNPLEAMTAKERRQLPAEVRQRLRQRAREHSGAPPARPKRRMRAQEEEAVAAPAAPQRLADRRAAAEQGPYRLRLDEQQTSATHVRVAELDSVLPVGFVVVRAATDTGPGKVLGFKRIAAGSFEGLRIKLDNALMKRTDIVVSLHSDDMERGVYRDGIDRLVRGTTGPILARATVTP